MYGGLSRPTALDSDSPFAIASHALNDKSTPTAPTLKIPTRRAPPAAPSPVQPHPHSPHPPHPAQQGPPPPSSSSSQGNAVQGDWRHHQNQGSTPMQSPGGGSGGYGLREGARDAYMGAGAFDARTGRYGPSATPAFPPQHQQHQQQGHPQHQQQQPHPQQHPQAAAQQYGSPQSSSRQPGYAQPYPPQGYPQQQQAQRPTTSQSAQSPAGPYPLVDRPARSPAPGQQGPSSHLQHQQQQQHQQGQPYPYSSSPANTTYAPSPAQLSATGSAASPGYYGPTSPGAVQAAGAGNNSMGMGGGMAGGQPTVVNPNQLSTRPQGQGGPRRSDSRDSATGQELWEMFSSMDLRRTGQLGNKEVMELLSRDSRWRITPREDCVKMLMSIFDSDRSGFISFSEFEGLWAYIKDWHKIFLRFDRDNSGTIDRSELDQALQSFGYPLPRDLVRKLEKRFAPPKDSGGSVPRGITFDRFLMACVTVKHFTEAFRRRDARNEGKLTIDYNTFMDLVIDAPV